MDNADTMNTALAQNAYTIGVLCLTPRNDVLSLLRRAREAAESMPNFTETELEIIREYGFR